MTYNEALNLSYGGQVWVPSEALGGTMKRATILSLRPTLSRRIVFVETIDRNGERETFTNEEIEQNLEDED